MKLLIQTVINKLDYWLGALAKATIFKNLKVKNNKIVFMTYNDAFMCNPKYIAEEIHDQGLDYELVWFINRWEKHKKENFPPYLRLVRRFSFNVYRELLSAKVWVDNSFNCVWFPIQKKEGQLYLNTWHGSLGLKRVGEDDVKNKLFVERAKTARENVSYCISNSDFEDEVFHSTYWPQTPILRLGHARNDILLSSDEEKLSQIKAKVRQHFGLEDDDKILLYAPTFRDSGTMDCYNIDFNRLIAALEQRFGGTWKVLLRYHFHNKDVGAKVEGSERVINATSYLDMQELLVLADAGISDYSSWVCDYVLTKRPTFLYTTDIKAYNTERGFYYPLETTPFPIATNNDELMANILNFDASKYIAEADAFLKGKGCIDDGHAAERVVGRMQEIIKST